jgi:hypothetical protein
MFKLNELTKKRKEQAINSIFEMSDEKAQKVKNTLRKNMKALKIIIDGGNTSSLKSEIASLSFYKAKEVFNYLNSILTGVQQKEQNDRWDELSQEFPHLKKH